MLETEKTLRLNGKKFVLMVFKKSQSRTPFGGSARDVGGLRIEYHLDGS